MVLGPRRDISAPSSVAVPARTRSIGTSGRPAATPLAVPRPTRRQPGYPYRPPLMIPVQDRHLRQRKRSGKAEPLQHVSDNRGRAGVGTGIRFSHLILPSTWPPTPLELVTALTCDPAPHRQGTRRWSVRFGCHCGNCTTPGSTTCSRPSNPATSSRVRSTTDSAICGFSRLNVSVPFRRGEEDFAGVQQPQRFRPRRPAPLRYWPALLRPAEDADVGDPAVATRITRAVGASSGRAAAAMRARCRQRGPASAARLVPGLAGPARASRPGRPPAAASGRPLRCG